MGRWLRQFPAWRGNDGGAGYFFWPTIRQEMAEVDRQSLEANGEASGLGRPTD